MNLRKFVWLTINYLYLGVTVAPLVIGWTAGYAASGLILAVIGVQDLVHLRYLLEFDFWVDAMFVELIACSSPFEEQEFCLLIFHTH